MVYLWASAGLTLEELAGKVGARVRRWGGAVDDVSVSLDTDEEKRYISLDGEQIRLDSEALAVVSHYVGAPAKFIERVTPDLQEHIINHQLQHVAARDVTVSISDDKVVGMVESSKAIRQIMPVQIVETIMEVLPPESEVIEWWCEPDDLRFDVIVPSDFDFAIGGDPAESDITRGGIRVGQDRKNNLSPWLERLLYRLRCTNGIEVPDASLRVDSRGNEPQETLMLLQGEIHRAVEGLDDTIKAYYDLREEPVPADRTGYVHRLGRERGLPDRTIGRVADLLPTEIGEEAEATSFDIVNLFTNLANAPDMINKRNPRRALQQTGGGMVGDHATRCRTCRSRLN